MSEIKEKLESKTILVCFNIKSLDLDKKEITFNLNFPKYLQETQENANELLEKLSKERTNFFSEVFVRGLELKYNLLKD